MLYQSTHCDLWTDLFLVGWFFSDDSRLSAAKVACCSSGSTFRPSNTTRSETSGAAADGKTRKNRLQWFIPTGRLGWRFFVQERVEEPKTSHQDVSFVYNFFATSSSQAWANRTRRQMSSQIDWWQRYPSGRVCQSWRTFCHCWSLK